MRTDTKLDILWEEMGTANSELAAVKAVTDQVSPLIPKIPKDYSTTETNTGVKWIDGDDIYCAVVTGEALPAGGSTLLLGIKQFVKAEGWCRDVFGNCYPLYTNIETENRQTLTVYQLVNETSIRVARSSGWSGPYAFILYYTKGAPTKSPDNEPETKKATKKKTTKNKED